MASYQPKISNFLAKPHQARSHNVGNVANNVILIDSSEESDTQDLDAVATQKKTMCSSVSIDRRDESRESKDSEESSADSELSVPQVSATYNSDLEDVNNVRAQNDLVIEDQVTAPALTG